MNSTKCSLCKQDSALPITLEACKHVFCYVCIKDKKSCSTCHVDIVENLKKLNLSEIKNKVIILDDSTLYPRVVWLYSSNDNKSWWKYDNHLVLHLEKNYQNFLSNEKYDNEISIGTNKYTIDYAKSIQYPVNEPLKRRTIMRCALENEDDELEMEHTYKIRGMSGLKR